MMLTNELSIFQSQNEPKSKIEILVFSASNALSNPVLVGRSAIGADV